MNNSIDSLSWRDVPEFAARLGRFLLHDPLSAKLVDASVRCTVAVTFSVGLASLRIARRSTRFRHAVERVHRAVLAEELPMERAIWSPETSLYPMDLVAGKKVVKLPSRDLIRWVQFSNRRSDGAQFSRVVTGLVLPPDSRASVLEDGALFNLLTGDVEAALNLHYALIRAAGHKRGELVIPEKSPTMTLAMKRVFAEYPDGGGWDCRLIPMRNALAHGTAEYRPDADLWHFRDRDLFLNLTTPELTRLLTETVSRATALEQVPVRVTLGFFFELIGEDAPRVLDVLVRGITDGADSIVEDVHALADELQRSIRSSHAD